MKRYCGRLALTLLCAALVGATAGPAQAETSTRSGVLSVTPAWRIKTYDRNPLTLPFTVTAPCTTTDYGSGITSTTCDLVSVDLVHPSHPASEGSHLVLPADDGTGSGSLLLYGFMLKGFGAHTLRATNTATGETATSTVVIKALTRTSAAFSRTRKAPSAATLRVTGRLTAFDGYSWSKPAGRYGLTLQRKVGSRWATVTTIRTGTGAATFTAKVKARGTYRVCHLGSGASTASCSSPKTL